MADVLTPAPPQLPLDAIAIRKILPHRYPFVLIDRVIEMDPGKTITAIKCVSQLDPYFTGHFPEQPIMPGVLQIEALAQTGAVLLLSEPGNGKKLAVLTGVDEFKFRRPVVPGDVLRIEVRDLRLRRNFGKALGRITCEGDVTCEGSISFAVVDPESAA